MRGHPTPPRQDQLFAGTPDALSDDELQLTRDLKAAQAGAWYARDQKAVLENIKQLKARLQQATQKRMRGTR